MPRPESERSPRSGHANSGGSHAGSASDDLDGWGERGREYLARRAEAGTPKGRAYSAGIESLPPGEASVEVRAMFALSATEDLAADIASDLQIDPAKAEMIAAEIATARRRLERATRPFRHAAAGS